MSACVCVFVCVFSARPPYDPIGRECVFVVVCLMFERNWQLQ